MLWIWKEKILSGSDQGEACQRRRDFNLDGICGDVRRKILRLLRLFFVTILAWLCISQWPRPLWRGLTNLWQLERDDSLVAV